MDVNSVSVVKHFPAALSAGFPSPWSGRSYGPRFIDEGIDWEWANGCHSNTGQPHLTSSPARPLSHPSSPTMATVTAPSGLCVCWPLPLHWIHHIQRRATPEWQLGSESTWSRSTESEKKRAGRDGHTAMFTALAKMSQGGKKSRDAA